MQRLWQPRSRAVPARAIESIGVGNFVSFPSNGAGNSLEVAAERTCPLWEGRSAKLLTALRGLRSTDTQGSAGMAIRAILVAALVALAVTLAACDEGLSEEDVEKRASEIAATITASSIGEDEGSRLEAVKDKGVLVCASNNSLAGFGYLDNDGNPVGFDIDLCRAVAVAVLGNSNAVEHRPTMSAERDPVMQSGEVDIIPGRDLGQLCADHVLRRARLHGLREPWRVQRLGVAGCKGLCSEGYNHRAKPTGLLEAEQPELGCNYLRGQHWNHHRVSGWAVQRLHHRPFRVGREPLRVLETWRTM